MKGALLVACIGLTLLFRCPDPLPEEFRGALAPDELRCLHDAYPEHIRAVRDGEVLWWDGTRMPHDDGLQKSQAERLETPDLEDQLAQRYPIGSGSTPPPRDFEPGRVRYLPLFHKIYGRDREEVEGKLATVHWLPGVSEHTLRVTRVNGVDERLRAVSRAILRLPSDVRSRAVNVSGGYNWRSIAGTERLSAHSFAIAVDVGTDWADYWRWSEPDADGSYPYRNRIPAEIVEAFEREGFIWGGKWYRYDTMHFEYRPELLAERCLAHQLPGTRSVAPPASGGRSSTAGTAPSSASSVQR